VLGHWLTVSAVAISGGGRLVVSGSYERWDSYLLNAVSRRIINAMGPNDVTDLIVIESSLLVTSMTQNREGGLDAPQAAANSRRRDATLLRTRAAASVPPPCTPLTAPLLIITPSRQVVDAVHSINTSQDSEILLDAKQFSINCSSRSMLQSPLCPLRPIVGF
jgi:hypothetical protein